MNYELAKKLKDVGFSQELTDPSSYYGANGKSYGWSEGEDKPYNNDYAKIPTLSELIEACGDGHFSLKRTGRLWVTEMGYGIEKPPEIASGSTPEEAVANLWIQLHTNK